MKNATLLLLALNALTVQAQTVPNPGFEILNPDNTLSNWGNVYLMPMWFDTLGNSFTDSVVIDNQFYAPTNDAHSGSTALELRNAWDFTTNTGIAGAVASDEDSVFSSWGLLNLVPTYSTPFNPFQPFNFGFYYKYFPVNGDSAFARIALWDSVGNQLAEGMAFITSGASTYTAISAPIYYFMPGDAAFYSLSFSTFYSTDPGSHQPSFGTRFLVDDIGFNFVTTTGLSDEDAVEPNIYPNPVTSELNIVSPSNKKFELEISNSLGAVILKTQNQNTIDVAGLPCGVYVARIWDGENCFLRKFLKQ